MKKENIEIRFFFSDKKIKNVLKIWRSEKRIFVPYSFTDFYFMKGNKIVKIRRWKSKHNPMLEFIDIERKRGLKKEESKTVKNMKDKVKELKDSGYKEKGIIEKKKAWLIYKTNKPTADYAIEFIPRLGWSGEIEVPEKDKNLIPSYINYLKNLGAYGFSKKPLLILFMEMAR